MPSNVRLSKADFFVDKADLAAGQQLVKLFHYAGGGSNTCCHMRGLFDRHDLTLLGVAWWLPPTKVCAESVNKENWKRVLSLTRLVLVPDAPINSASFLLGASIAKIKKENKWVSLVTYADESQGHTGAIYRATNWAYAGRTGPYVRWLAGDGRQVSAKSTVNRTKAEMVALGHRQVGKFFKHKFVMHFGEK